MDRTDAVNKKFKNYFYRKVFVLIKNLYILEFFIFQRLIHKKNIFLLFHGPIWCSKNVILIKFLNSLIFIFLYNNFYIFEFFNFEGIIYDIEEFKNILFRGLTWYA